MRKSIRILLLFSILLTNCKSRLTLDNIKIDNNTLVVVNNEWVLINPNDFINKIKTEPNIELVELPRSEIKYENNIEKIIGINKVSEFNTELGIDYEFFKEIDPKKSIFYMIDGMPTHNYNFVAEYLISRKIKEINRIGINQAIAIWGKREGKNGAIQIKTFDKGDVVIPIIVN